MWWLEAVCKSLGQAFTCWYCGKFPQRSRGILRWEGFAGGQAGQSMLHFKWIKGESSLWGWGLKVGSASFIDGAKVVRDGLEFSLGRHKLPIPIPELDTTVSLFGSKATNRLTKVEGLGSLGKRGGWLLLEEVFKVPKALDAGFRERLHPDLRGITPGVEPEGGSNIRPGLGELCIEVSTGIVSGLMWVQLETTCRHVTELLGDFRALSQSMVDSGEGPFLLPRRAPGEESAVWPGHGGMKWEVTVADGRDKGKMCKWSGCFGESIRLVGSAKDEVYAGFDSLGP
ncbi:unnamed protein product [Symbiodinium sp. KB8]|nr:unnamed protein product [Symbiodinium sp. KB8]